MPPELPRPPGLRDTGPLKQEELRRAYGVYHRTPPQGLLNSLLGPFQGLHANRLFAVAPLLHGATSVYARQLEGFLNPGERVSDNLVDVWIWWFHLHQPDQG